MKWEDMAFSDFNRMMLHGGYYPAAKGNIKVFILRSKVKRLLRAWIKETGEENVRNECGYTHYQLKTLEDHLFIDMKTFHYKKTLHLIEKMGEVEAMKYLKTLLNRRSL